VVMDVGIVLMTLNIPKERWLSQRRYVNLVQINRLCQLSTTKK
jgi:hypothetical protein